MRSTTTFRENGDGVVDIPIAVKAASSGRVKISNIDITYAMQTRAVDASFEGGLAAPTAFIETSSPAAPATMLTTSPRPPSPSSTRTEKTRPSHGNGETFAT